jgi:hypothetical protein
MLLATAAIAQTDTSAPTASDDLTVLSPFEISASNDKGYYGANTMSGTRFNAKISDLASSITIITKDQMADFAMLDINDVFLYTAGTQGSGTFTDISVDRNGSVSDNTQLNPTQANRVRGIASANISLNNIETMARVPVDPIMIDSLEISRGPNANVFGLGNPSGTVNMVASSADLKRNHVQATFRGDDLGGYRDSLDFNQVLLRNKLAVRFSQVFQHDAFERKPSGVDTERYNGMIKYQPFKSTTVTAFISSYRMDGTRPNTIPPRDNVSYWIKSGKPTWDPIAQVIHVNNQSINVYALSTGAAFPSSVKGTNTNGVPVGTTVNTDYFSSALLGGNHNQMFIDQSGLAYWSAPQATSNTATILPGATAVGPTSLYTMPRYLLTTGAPGATGTAAKPSGQPLFITTPTVSDKSLYDYSSINIASVNHDTDKTVTSYVQLDQSFLNTPQQTLVAQVAFMREDSKRYQRNLIGGANDLGQSGELMVDVNEKLLDGSPNPFFLRPFIATDKPRTAQLPSKWDTSRAQIAYKLDLSKETSALKWIGTHTFTGYSEYKYRVNRSYSYRDAIASPNPWIPPGVARGNQGTAPAGTPANILLTQGLYRYYVGDATGQNVDYAPTAFSYGTYPFVWAQSTAGSPTAAATITKVNSEPSLLSQVASTDSAGGTFNNKTVIRTKGAVMQNHLIDDRIVTTIGIRQDDTYTKFGATPALNADGMTFNSAAMDGWENHDWRADGGHTKNIQVVARPFARWSAVEQMIHNGGVSGLVGDFLNNLSISYNDSNSFLVATPAQDLYQDKLPNPTGHEKSWGFGFSLRDDAIVVRVNHYDDLQKDARNNDASTLLQRATRIDMSPTGQTPNPARLLFQADAWIRYQHPTWTDSQVRDEETTETGISATEEAFLFNPSPPFAAAADVKSKGTEIEINFNPNRYWTVAASVSEGRTVNSNVSPALQQWLNERLQVWTTIVDPRIGAAGPGGLTPTPGNETAHLWWNQLYAGATSNQTASLNYLAFVATPFNVVKQLEGKSNPQFPRYMAQFSTNYKLAGITENHILKKFSIGGAMRWRDKQAIGYAGVPDANGIYQSLDTNKPFYDASHLSIDAFVSYRTKLLRDKIATTIQLNARNIEESGRLEPIQAFPDGSISTYRIVDPRTFILTVSFDL